MSSAICFDLDQYKILSSGNGLMRCFLNPLPNDKTLDVTKSKAFADKKLNIAKMMISTFDIVENTLGKGENACYKCFPKPSSLGSLEVWIVW